MRKERGAALVEFVMILPVLTALFLGIVQFGLVLRETQIVQNAAREGARLSMLPQYSQYQWDGSGTCPLTALGNLAAQYLSQENISVSVSSTTNCTSTGTSTGGTATLTGGGVSSATVVIDQNFSITSGGTTVGASKVTISYTKSPIVGGSFFGNFTYKGVAVFRNLY